MAGIVAAPRVLRCGAATVVVLADALRGAAVDQLSRTLFMLSRTGHVLVVIDAGLLCQMDGSALAALDRSRELFSIRGGCLELAGVRPRLRNMLTHLHTRFRVYGTVREAMSAHGWNVVPRGCTDRPVNDS